MRSKYNGQDKQFDKIVNEVRCNECKKFAPKIDSVRVRSMWFCCVDHAMIARDKQDRRRIK